LRPSWSGKIWTANVLLMFRPQIDDSLRQCNTLVTNREKEHPDVIACGERKLKITSIIYISFEDHMRRVNRGLQKADSYNLPFRRDHSAVGD